MPKETQAEKELRIAQEELKKLEQQETELANGNTEDIKAQMDQAAKLASAALDKLDPAEVLSVARWIKANYLKAGYKRLSKLLVAKAR